MPCTDGGYTAEQQAKIDAEARKAEREKRMMAAMLCAICTVLESNRELVRRDGQSTLLPAVLDKVDWEEAGVKRTEFAVWWDRHKEEDRKRRKREAAEAARRDQAKKRREEALAKLTLADRRVLGL